MCFSKSSGRVTLKESKIKHKINQENLLNLLICGEEICQFKDVYLIQKIHSHYPPINKLFSLVKLYDELDIVQK